MNLKILVFLLLVTVSTSLLLSSRKDPKKEMAGPAKIVFKSIDGGQTWQDISKGLPEDFRVDSIRGNSFLANDKGLYLKAGNELYHNTPNTTLPLWTKETISGKNSSMAPGKPRPFYWGVNLKTTNGTNVWSPVLGDFERPRLGIVFETAGGTIFIGTDKGILRSTDNGKTWKLVYEGGLVGHLAESNGVLVSVSMRKIIRSTDNGETWEQAISEDSAAWDVKPFKGGFVATTSVSESGTRRLSTSYDGGKTWQSIHSALQDKVVLDSIWRTWNDRPVWRTVMAPIIQVGENLFCLHPDGIFRSTDKGKTWKLLLPSIDEKGFNLFVSGNVIYAIRSKGGC